MPIIAYFPLCLATRGERVYREDGINRANVTSLCIIDRGKAAFANLAAKGTAGLTIGKGFGNRGDIFAPPGEHIAAQAKEILAGFSLQPPPDQVLAHDLLHALPSGTTPDTAI